MLRRLAVPTQAATCAWQGQLSTVWVAYCGNLHICAHNGPEPQTEGHVLTLKLCMSSSVTRPKASLCRRFLPGWRVTCRGFERDPSSCCGGLMPMHWLNIPWWAQSGRCGWSWTRTAMADIGNPGVLAEAHNRLAWGEERWRVPLVYCRTRVACWIERRPIRSCGGLVVMGLYVVVWSRWFPVRSQLWGWSFFNQKANLAVFSDELVVF